MKKRLIIAVAVLAIAAVAALVIALNGLPNGHGPRMRTQSEVMMLARASEAYRIDHGHYPTDPATTEILIPNTSYDPAAYIPASAFLYLCLTGKGPAEPDGSQPVNYLPDIGTFLLRTTPAGVTYFADPYGNSIGYSTFKNIHPESPDGYNDTTFDLWSTGGGKSKGDMPKWIKNW